MSTKRFKTLFESVDNPITTVRDASDSMDHPGIHTISNPRVLQRVNKMLRALVTNDRRGDQKQMVTFLRLKLNFAGVDFDPRPLYDSVLPAGEEVAFPITSFGGRWGKTVDTAFDQFDSSDGIEEVTGHGLQLILVPDGEGNFLDAFIEAVEPDDEGDDIEDEIDDIEENVNESKKPEKGSWTATAIVNNKVKKSLPIEKSETADAVAYFHSIYPDAVVSIETPGGTVHSVHKPKKNNIKESPTVNASTGAIAGLDGEPPVSKKAQKKHTERNKKSSYHKEEKSFGDFMSSLEEKKRCWKGYKPTPGKKPYEKGSCQKEEDSTTKTADVDEARKPVKSIPFTIPQRNNIDRGNEKIKKFLNLPKLNKTMDNENFPELEYRWRKHQIIWTGSNDGKHVTLEVSGPGDIYYGYTGTTIPEVVAHFIKQKFAKESISESAASRVGKTMKTVDGEGTVTKEEPRYGSANTSGIVQVRLKNGKTGWYYYDGDRVSAKIQKEKSSTTDKK